VNRIEMKGGKKQKKAVSKFSSEGNERVKILVNSCISKVNRIGVRVSTLYLERSVRGSVFGCSAVYIFITSPS